MRILSTVGVVLLFTTCAFGQSARITWIGQSGFLIQSDGGGPTIVADPPSPSIGYPIPDVNANIVTVSHNHGDHNYTAGVKGNFAVVDGRPVTSRSQMTVGTIPFVLIPGFHDGQSGVSNGPNTIIQWTQSGLRFAHFGDFGQDTITDAQLADLQNIDVAFFPAGGYFTVDVEQAAALANQIGARVTILMHYKTPLGGAAQTASLPAAAAPFNSVIYKPSTLVLSKSSLPDTRQTWVMEPTADAVTVNAATFTQGIPVAPASLATLQGTFNGATTAAASTLPLPTTLGQTQVMIQGAAVPLTYVSATQINLQIPGGLSPGQYLVQVIVGGQSVARTSVTVVNRSPGIFSAANPDGRANASITPTRAGEQIQLYGTGQGPNSGTSGVADGVPASSVTPAYTRGLPAITIGGVAATVLRSALMPGQVGVWQLGVSVPTGVPTGPSVPVVVTLGSLSATFPLAIR